MDDENRLGEYLVARRALVTPESVGLLAGSNRRVPGLRREEVSLLAGISVDYYFRLERGRDRNPSPQVLESLARVLRLDDVETEYLLGLGGAALRPHRSRRADRVPPRALDLLAALEVPAFIENRYFDVLASNPLALAFNPRLVPGENRMRSLLLDPAERDFQQDWEHAVQDFVASFRRSLGDAAEDQRAAELVGELSIASARFRTLWARHDVRRLDGGTAQVDHPVLGPLRLHRDKLPLGDLILVVYYPEQHTPDAERLGLLATLIRSEDTAPA